MPVTRRPFLSLFVFVCLPDADSYEYPATSIQLVLHGYGCAYEYTNIVVQKKLCFMMRVDYDGKCNLVSMSRHALVGPVQRG